MVGNAKIWAIPVVVATRLRTGRLITAGVTFQRGAVARGMQPIWAAVAGLVMLQAAAACAAPAVACMVTAVAECMQWAECAAAVDTEAEAVAVGGAGGAAGG